MIYFSMPNLSTTVIKVEGESITFNREQVRSSSKLVVQLDGRQAYLKHPRSYTGNDVLDINSALTRYNIGCSTPIGLIELNKKVQNCFDFSVERELHSGFTSAYIRELEPNTPFSILCTRPDKALESPRAYIVRRHEMEAVSLKTVNENGYPRRFGNSGEGGQLIYVSHFASSEQFRAKYPLSKYVEACLYGEISDATTPIQVPSKNREEWYKERSELLKTFKAKFELTMGA